MTDTRVQEIPLDSIFPDTSQPRNLPLSVDELIEKKESGDRRAKEIWYKVTELATSILETGLQQPITVYPEDEKFILYDGHRRWMAMTLLHRQGHGTGKTECYVRPKPQSEDDILLGQLSANIQREDLNVFELARSLQQVHQNLKEEGSTVRLVREDGSIESVKLELDEPDDVIWDIIEKTMGISRSRRYQIQAVLKLPPKIQRIAEEKALPESRLRLLIPLKDEPILETLIQEIIEKDLSNAQIKKRIEELQGSLSQPAAMPKPVQIRSAIKPIKELARDVREVKNVALVVSKKDPRTVTSYQTLIPELRSAIRDLEVVLGELEYLETR